MAIVSHEWNGGKLILKLDDGTAEMEWITSVAFRFARSWDAAPAAKLSAIQHNPVQPTFEEAAGMLVMRTKYLTVELDRADLKLRVKAGSVPVARNELAKTEHGVELRMELPPEEKIFGLMRGETGKLNLRGETLFRRDGFFFTSAGYGMFVTTPTECFFNTLTGRIAAQGMRSFEYAFYYGPAPKEVLEQHLALTSRHEVKEDSLALLAPNRLPEGARKLPASAIDSWAALADLVRTLNQWSLSGVLYPAFDLAAADGAPEEVRQRTRDLSALLPIVYRSSGQGGLDQTKRNMWTPYLITYLREAYDRGIPVIRPLPLQFAKDADADQQAEVFMLGDEVLMAPVVAAGTKQRLHLPRGLWTDLRTNVEYRGNQTIEVDAPMGTVPMFARNGWIVPLAMPDRMQLHYFPSLGAEFFLWEPDPLYISQFHAAPAGEYMRLEIESKVTRTYEWVVHHTGPAREVSDGAAWRHDAANNNLHVTVAARAGSDHIVNISF